MTLTCCNVTVCYNVTFCCSLLSAVQYLIATPLHFCKLTGAINVLIFLVLLLLLCYNVTVCYIVACLLQLVICSAVSHCHSLTLLQVNRCHQRVHLSPPSVSALLSKCCAVFTYQSLASLGSNLAGIELLSTSQIYAVIREVF